MKADGIQKKTQYHQLNNVLNILLKMSNMKTIEHNYEQMSNEDFE